MQIRQKLYQHFIFKPNHIINQQGSGPRVSFCGFSDIYPSMSPSAIYTPVRYHFNHVLNFLINDLDARVDLYNHNAKARNERYEINIGFGTAYREIANTCLNNILILTEDDPRSLQRFEANVIDKNPKQYIAKRSGLFYNVDDIKVASSIIIIGDSERQRKVSSVGECVNIKCGGLKNNIFKLQDISPYSGRLVWFGSGGIFLKGLDIAIEVADRLGRPLTIIGANPRELKSVKIDKKHQIIRRLDVRSRKFLNVVKRCDLLLFPSWSEGMATSVVTMMMHGIIPITGPNCGFSDTPYVRTVTNNDVEEYLIKIGELERTTLTQEKKNIFLNSRIDFDINFINNQWVKAIYNAIK